MNFRSDQKFQTTKSELKSAEVELGELTQQLKSFEVSVDARLGSLLDQLITLNSETTALDEELRHIRENRLFGCEVMRYLDGAPRPVRPPDLTDLPPIGLPHRKTNLTTSDNPPSSSEQFIPDIKVLYRRLARRYHPDLARSDADRAYSNEQMKEINQAYTAGDLRSLMRLAGMSIPYGLDLNQPKLQIDEHRKESMTELEQVERNLQSVRLQIHQLSRLPIVKLSLDVKLARHQGRDLLGEMAAELQYKLSRKMAERDYLRAQINASEGL